MRRRAGAPGGTGGAIPGGGTAATPPAGFSPPGGVSNFVPRTPFTLSCASSTFAMNSRVCRTFFSTTSIMNAFCTASTIFRASSGSLPLNVMRITSDPSCHITINSSSRYLMGSFWALMVGKSLMSRRAAFRTNSDLMRADVVFSSVTKSVRACCGLLWLASVVGTLDTWSIAYDSYLLASSSHAASAPAPPSSVPQNAIISQWRRR